MKTIEVSDELYEKLVEISNGLNTQDHRSTAMPYFFQIMTKQKQPVPDGFGDHIVWVGDGTGLETDEEIYEFLSEARGEEIEEIKKLSWSKIEDILEEQGFKKFDYEYREEYQNAFFTEKACREHIKANAHHYNDGVDYISHAFRNPEMETVLEFLCGLTGGEIHR